ncbi:hypothetical protein MASR1M31_14450 [Porphyromonadaceae bacterium]
MNSSARTLYRINTIHIEIPPLRERSEDILILCDLFLARYAESYNKPPITLSNSAKEKLSQYAWPGNIRELQHTIEKAVIITDRTQLEASDFSLTAKQPLPPIDSSSLEEMESSLIKASMEKHNGNLSQVAAQLEISRQTLYNKIKRYDL